MGIASIPSAGGGGIKSVQRGSAGGSGNVTITAVDIAKSFVHIFGTASSGTVSSSFGMSIGGGSARMVGMRGMWGALNYGDGAKPTGASNLAAVNIPGNANNVGAWTQYHPVNAGTVTVNAGSNNLVAAAVQGFLANSTTLTVSGACRYEVVEFN